MSYHALQTYFVSHDSTSISSKLRAVVTNLLQEFDGGMESKTTPIQEREDDEDITMLDTPEIWSSMSYKSSPTWSSNCVHILSCLCSSIRLQD
jgi:hypothetical protein